MLGGLRVSPVVWCGSMGTGRRHGRSVQPCDPSEGAVAHPRGGSDLELGRHADRVPARASRQPYGHLVMP